MFVKGYELIARPLIDLLKKDNFQWTEVTKLAFEQLKQAVITSPVLALPDFSQPITIVTNAYQKGI